MARRSRDPPFSKMLGVTEQAEVQNKGITGWAHLQGIEHFEATQMKIMIMMMIIIIHYCDDDYFVIMTMMIAIICNNDGDDVDGDDIDTLQWKQWPSNDHDASWCCDGDPPHNSRHRAITGCQVADTFFCSNDSASLINLVPRASQQAVADSPSLREGMKEGMKVEQS